MNDEKLSKTATGFISKLAGLSTIAKCVLAGVVAIVVIAGVCVSVAFANHNKRQQTMAVSSQSKTLPAAASAPKVIQTSSATSSSPEASVSSAPESKLITSSIIPKSVSEPAWKTNYRKALKDSSLYKIMQQVMEQGVGNRGELGLMDLNFDGTPELLVATEEMPEFISCIRKIYTMDGESLRNASQESSWVLDNLTVYQDNVTKKYQLQCERVYAHSTVDENLLNFDMKTVQLTGRSYSKIVSAGMTEEGTTKYYDENDSEISEAESTRRKQEIENRYTKYVDFECTKALTDSEIKSGLTDSEINKFLDSWKPITKKN